MLFRIIPIKYRKVQEKAYEYPQKVQALEKNQKRTIIPSYEDFIGKVKKFIRNNEEKVDLYSEEPSDFIFGLFRYKIGLDF